MSPIDSSERGGRGGGVVGRGSAHVDEKASVTEGRRLGDVSNRNSEKKYLGKKWYAARVRERGGK